jgi:2-oxoglutarate ferredoxin oxidoreductase subunit beta
MNTYGFHGIHGRAAAIASGLKISRPDLSVWVTTGDGDLLSIGGNHFIHLLRRNVDLNVLLFNNRIYGLTKGQFSPTSEHGKKTKSSPFGVIDYPFNPLLLALGAEGTFIARSIDREPKHLQQTILRAAKHKGTSFIEIFQNCNIFNDGTFELLTEKNTKDDNVVILENGKPLVFGKEKEKGLHLDGFKLEIINIKDGRYSINDVLTYDEKSKDLAYLIARLTDTPGFPTPIGVFLDIERSTYDEEMQQQIESAKKKLGDGNLNSLFNSGNTWNIE